MVESNSCIPCDKRDALQLARKAGGAIHDHGGPSHPNVQAIYTSPVSKNYLVLRVNTVDQHRFRTSPS